jgi:carbon-monoxide dehydrogenase iron sulfur subunit
MSKRVICKEDVCIGCHLCEINCITAHSSYPHDIWKAFKLQKERPIARVLVEEKGETSFALSCRQCREPECVKSCLTGALRIDPVSGVVVLAQERCIGCWTCIVSCPYGAIRPSGGKRMVATKCDLCRGIREVPACVAGCPNDALELADGGEE